MKTNSNLPLLATNPGLLKQINYSRLLELLRCRAPITRAELARLTGLTRSTVTVITAELLADGLVQETGETIAPTGGGRPGTGLCLNPQGAFFIGAAIEAEHLTVIELNLAAQMTQRLQAPIHHHKTPEAVLSQLIDLIQQVQANNPLSQQRSRGIGLTIQGTMSLDGTVIYAPFLSWRGIDLRSHLQPHIDVPLFVDNDANAAALAEVYLGSATQTHSLLYVLINRGMGAGIVINNRVFRGASGTAGEVGATLIDPQSPVYDEAGNRMDVGTFIGKDMLLRQYQEQTGQPLDVNKFVDRLSHADPVAEAIMAKWTQLLGWELVNLVSVLNPAKVVIGGPLTALLPFVREQLHTMLREYVPGNGIDGFFSNPKASLEASSFGEDAAAIGGAVLVYQSLFQVPDLVLLEG